MMIHLFLAEATAAAVCATPGPAAGIAAASGGTATAIGPSTVAKLAVALLLGAAGQGARVIVGLKKTSDEAKAANTSFGAQFEASQLLVSLLIGAIAGLFSALAIWQKMASLDNRETLLALVAAGYAGADFIEGFMRNEATSLPNKGITPALPGLHEGLEAKKP
ncbi:MAG: hypothetical protein ACREIF_10760 [Chthoniobacterales bacterium]